MECTTVGNLIRQYAHLTDQEIEGYVEKTLDVQSLEMVEKHLRSCAYCAKEVEILREAFKAPNLIDDPNLSDDVVRQRVSRILDRIRPNYSQAWLGDKVFPLEHSKDHPELLRIGGDLILAEFEDAIDEDREIPGTFALRIEGNGLDSVSAPMRDFKKVHSIHFQKLKRFTGAKPSDRMARPDEALELEPVLVYSIPDGKLEVLRDESSTILFLRLT